MLFGIPKQLWYFILKPKQAFHWQNRNQIRLLFDLIFKQILIFRTV